MAMRVIQARAADVRRVWTDPELTLPAAAAALGMSTDALKARAAAIGLPHRRTGRREAIRPHQESEFRLMWRAGVSARVIGEAFGCSYFAVINTAMRLGLRQQLVRWIVEYNLPGAALPSIWRVRPKNERAEAETREKKAASAEATDRAIRAIVRAAAKFDDDQVAREYIVSFDVTDRLSDKTIDALVAARQEFGDETGADPEANAMPPGAGDPAMFSAARLKKKA